jgi:hypothetical protein
MVLPSEVEKVSCTVNDLYILVFGLIVLCFSSLALTILHGQKLSSDELGFSLI